MGKLNDYAINMLLAKMYLNHNAWFNDYSDNSYYGKAIDEVNEVINSGKFSLAPNYSDNLEKIFPVRLKLSLVFRLNSIMPEVTIWQICGCM